MLGAVKRPAWLNSKGGDIRAYLARSRSQEVAGTTGALTPSEMECHGKILGRRVPWSDV